MNNLHTFIHTQRKPALVIASLTGVEDHCLSDDSYLNWKKNAWKERT